MDIVELRDLDEARKYLLQGLLLQRVAAPPTAAAVRDALAWAQEIAAAGDPLPPVGFVADLGQAVFYPDRTARGGREGLLPLLLEKYKALTEAVRRCPEVLTGPDVTELEKRTALADLGQRVAFRQVLDTAERFHRHLPHQKVKPLAGRQEVPTRV